MFVLSFRNIHDGWAIVTACDVITVVYNHFGFILYGCNNISLETLLDFVSSHAFKAEEEYEENAFLLLLLRGRFSCEDKLPPY